MYYIHDSNNGMKGGGSWKALRHLFEFPSKPLSSGEIMHDKGSYLMGELTRERNTSIVNINGEKDPNQMKK